MNEHDNWPVTGPVRFGLITATLFAASFGAWASLTTVSGAVIAPGRISVEENRRPVQHPDGGRVAALVVHEGQAVAAGDLLVRLDGSELSAELAGVEGRLGALLAEEARLTAERDDAGAITYPGLFDDLSAHRPEVATLRAAQDRLLKTRQAAFAAEAEQLRLRADDARAESTDIGREVAAVRAQLAGVDADLATQKALLEKGLTERPRVSALEREGGQLRAALAEADTRLAQAQGAETAAETERLRSAMARQADTLATLRQIGADVAALGDRRRVLLQKIAGLDLRAPVGGTVLGLRALSTAAVLGPAEPALFIVPGRTPLIVEARIDPTDVDQVHVGQTARLRVTSFDARQTPDLEGRVTQVSPDVLSDPDHGGAFYRAEIELPPATRSLPGTAALRPGMPTEVFLTTGDRTPLSYLTSPLMAYFSRALREG